MSISSERNKALKVILDSNALFIPFKFKIDIFEEVERLLNRNAVFVLLVPVKRELELLVAKKSYKIRREAAYVLKLAEKCKTFSVDNDENLPTDEVIAKTAKAWNSPVFTNDKQLRKKLRDISVPVIYVRQKSRLEIDGLI